MPDAIDRAYFDPDAIVSSERVEIAAPAALVWEILVDLPRYGEWNPFCIAAESTLEMGAPVKIVDLARQMIEMSGRVPDVDIPIVFTGLKPGEKMTEALIDADEAGFVLMAGIRQIVQKAGVAAFPAASTAALSHAACQGEVRKVRQLIHAMLPSFDVDEGKLGAEAPLIYRSSSGESQPGSDLRAAEGEKDTGRIRSARLGCI